MTNNSIPVYGGWLDWRRESNGTYAVEYVRKEGKTVQLGYVTRPKYGTGWSISYLNETVKTIKDGAIRLLHRWASLPEHRTDVRYWTFGDGVDVHSRFITFRNALNSLCQMYTDSSTGVGFMIAEDTIDLRVKRGQWIETDAADAYPGFDNPHFPELTKETLPESIPVPMTLTGQFRELFADLLAADTKLDELVANQQDTGNKDLNAAIIALRDSVHAARSMARLTLSLAKDHEGE